MTKIINIINYKKDIDKIKYIPKEFSKGKTIVFPTETVYGLGANGLDCKSVEKIFIAKNRPIDNPLILHIYSINQLKNLAYISDNNIDNIKKFIPGPITFVFKKKKIVPDIISAGRDTVAIRFPAHPIANYLVKNSKLPIAAPSANISGRPSPTKSNHVIDDLYHKVDYIITCGDLKYGIESTVLDLSEDKPVILRPGPIPPEIIKNVFKNLIVPEFVYGKIDPDVAIAPGMKYRHYSTKVPLILIENRNDTLQSELVKKEYKIMNNSIILCKKEHSKYYNDYNYLILSEENNFYEYGFKLYDYLRDLEKKYDKIIVEGIKDEGIGIAIMNRLRKAAYNII